MLGVENDENGIGLGGAGHAAAKNVDGDAGVFRVRREGVDAGQIDEREVVAAYAGHEAHALLDGDAGVVGNFLTEAGEAIEEGGFSGVGGADEDDCAQSGRGQGRRWGNKGRCVAAGVHPRASRN